MDHGHFLHGVSNDLNDLISAPIDAFEAIVLNASITSQELEHAAHNLEEVTIEMIVWAVADPPDEWGLTANDRLQLAEILYDRQQKFLNRYRSKSPNINSQSLR